MAGRLPQEFDEPVAGVKASIALRDFPLGTSRSLVFTFAGGLGDVFVALEAVVALRRSTFLLVAAVWSLDGSWTQARSASPAVFP